MPVSELDRTLEEQILRLCAVADSHFEYGEPALALEQHLKAWEMIPEPRTERPISAQVLAMVGDCYLELDRDQDAKKAFTQALQCRGAKEDPLLHLRLGMACYELDQFDNARQHLNRADALNDAEMGEGEDRQFAALLKSKIRLYPGDPLPSAR